MSLVKENYSFVQYVTSEPVDASVPSWFSTIKVYFCYYKKLNSVNLYFPFSCHYNHTCCNLIFYSKFMLFENF